MKIQSPFELFKAARASSLALQMRRRQLLLLLQQVTLSAGAVTAAMIAALTGQAVAPRRGACMVGDGTFVLLFE